MNINEQTVLTQKAHMFASGEGGSHKQIHVLLADDIDTGVTIVVTGNRYTQQQKIEYRTINGDFDDYKEALIDAGHTVV